MNDKLDNPYYIGVELIKSAISIDKALADLLKIELSRIKKSIKENNESFDIDNSHKVIRNIILTLIITDDKIKSGMELCKKDLRS